MCYTRITRIILMTFAEQILNEKPVICFDELLLVKYEIDNSEIRLDQ